jgi:hypothetical protein
MPTRQSNPVIRHKIRLCETIIKERSKQVEEKWSIDPNQSNGKIGSRVDKNLSVLEILDGYNFDRIDSSNDCLDNLYNKLFGGNNSNNSSTGSSSNSGGSSGSGLDVEVKYLQCTKVFYYGNPCQNSSKLLFRVLNQSGETMIEFALNLSKLVKICHKLSKLV